MEGGQSPAARGAGDVEGSENTRVFPYEDLVAASGLAPHAMGPKRKMPGFQGQSP